MIDIVGLFGGGSTAAEEGQDEARKALWWGMSETSNAVQRAMDAYLNAAEQGKGAYQAYLSPYINWGLETIGPEGKLGPRIDAGFNALANQYAPLLGTRSAVDQISGLPPGVASDLTNYLTQTQAYQFPLQEGLKALDRTAAARGMALSGAQSKAAQTFGQNYALSNALNPAMTNYQNYLKNYLTGLTGYQANYQDYLNNYWKQAGMGQAASSQMAPGLAGISSEYGQRTGQANLVQAQLQNALAGKIAQSYAMEGLLRQGRQEQSANALNSILGFGMNLAAQNIPWGNIFGGGSSGGGDLWSGNALAF